ncbi:hypothetical protein [Salinibacter phage M8CRM-1]|uniref:Uncharacterized protein n=1 Tax=Salinibacter phage M8CRM-1 TaxID=2681612 RepID=A0A2I6UGI5_9CAUD|nr:hypothetical protein FGG67_gp27 [Salinibacter phage M8CRM-1]AUO79113.1 hypothetical protein [Salinibacter phage M8CRM-1]
MSDYSVRIYRYGNYATTGSGEEVDTFPISRIQTTSGGTFETIYNVYVSGDRRDFVSNLQDTDWFDPVIVLLDSNGDTYGRKINKEDVTYDPGQNETKIPCPDSTLDVGWTNDGDFPANKNLVSVLGDYNVSSGGLDVGQGPIPGSVLKSGQDFETINFGGYEESVEYEESRFKLDNISLTVDTVPEWYWKEGDQNPLKSSYAPYVCEVREGSQADWNTSEVLFHGVIDGESVQYVADTTLTNFKVWSWDYLLTQVGELPARSIYETESFKGVDVSDVERGDVGIPVPSSIVTFQGVSVGDVVELDSDSGAIRSAIQSIESTDEIGVKKLITSIPAKQNISFDSASLSRPTIVGFGNPNRVAESVGLLGAGDLSRFETEGLEVTVTFGTKDFTRGVEEIRTFTDVEGNVVNKLKFDNTIIPDVDIDQWDEIRVTKKNVIKEGDDIKIYGRDAYGYYPGVGRDFKVIDTDGSGNPTGLIPAILSLGDTPRMNLLSNLIDTFTFGGDTDYVDHRMTFPKKPQEALSAIQHTAGVFVKMVPKADASDPSKPKIEVRVIDKKSLESGAIESPFDVKTWSEKAVPSPIKAVVVETEDYPTPDEYGDICGFYPAPSPDSYTDKPEGDGVVEISTVQLPSLEGPIYSGSDSRLVNDSNLYAIAKARFAYYDKLSGRGKATLYGAHTDIVGRQFTFNDVYYEEKGGTLTGRTVFVTKASVNLEEGETEIEFRRGEYTAPTESFVRINVDAPDRLVAEGGTAPLVLDASQSIAPAGTDYDWSISGAATGTQSSQIARFTGVPTGSVSWTLTLTLPDGTILSESGSVSVVQGDRRRGDTRAEVEHEALERSNKGVVKVLVSNDGEQPSSVQFQKVAGGNVKDTTNAVSADTVNSVSNGTEYVGEVDLVERHASQIRAIVQFDGFSPVVIGPLTFDQDNVPSPAYNWTWEYNTTTQKFDLYVSVNGDADTGSVECVTTYSDNSTDTNVHNGRNTRFKANTSKSVTPESNVELKLTAYSGTNATGTPQSESQNPAITAPVAPDSIDSVVTDNRYVQESGDTMAGDLSFDDGSGTGGRISAKEKGVEVKEQNTGNYGSLTVSELIVSDGTKATQIESEVVEIADSLFELNSNYTGSSPSASAGLYVNRGSKTDKGLVWNEALDRWGISDVSNDSITGSTFKRFVVEDGGEYGIDISGDATTLGGFGVDKFPRFKDTSGRGTYAGTSQPSLLSESPIQVWADSTTDAPDVHIGNLAGLPKKDESGNIPASPSTYGVGSYGIWLRPSDRAIVEGNVSFDGGSWIVQKDASYLIEDGVSGNPLLRMGKESVSLDAIGKGTATRRGFHAYDGNGNVQAFFTRDGFSFAGGSLEGDGNTLAIDVSDFSLSSGGLSVDSVDSTIKLGTNLYNSGIVLDGGAQDIRMYDSDFGSTKSDDAVRIGSDAQIPSSVGVITDLSLVGISSSVPSGQAENEEIISFSVNDRFAPIEIPLEVQFNYSGSQGSYNNLVVSATLKTSGGTEIDKFSTDVITVSGSENKKFSLSLNGTPLGRTTSLVLSVRIGCQGVIGSSESLTFKAEKSITNASSAIEVKQYQPRIVINSRGIFTRYAPNKIASLFNQGGSSGGSTVGNAVLSVFGRTGNVTAENGDYSASQISGFDSAAVSAVNNDPNHATAASHNYFSGNYNDLSNRPSIAYTSTIAADAFTSTEVSNLRSGKLDDGTTPWTSNNYFDASDARSAVGKGDVGLGNVPNENPRSEMRNLGLSNEETINSWVGGHSGAQIGYDASMGLFISYGSSGSGVPKGLYPVLDVGNTTTDSNISISYSGGDARPNVSLVNDSVTIAGNTVPLGGSTTLSHSDISGISSDDHHSKTTSASELTDVSPDSVSDAHHVRYTDSEAVDAVGPRFQTGSGISINYDSVNQIIGVTVDATTDPITAINNDADHGSTASHNYYTDSDARSAINGSSLQGLDVGNLTVNNNTVSPDSNADAHHVRYTDSEAVDAVGPRFQTGSGISITYDSTNQIIGVSVDATTDPVTAINNDSDHGSTASHNYYTDTDAIQAINESSLQGLEVTNLTAGGGNSVYHTGNLNPYTDSDARNAVTYNTLNGRVEIRNDSNDQNALRVIQRKNDPDAPASILVATDDDGEDVAIEVRGNGDGSSVDLTENTQTSADMNLQIWSSGKIETKGDIITSGVGQFDITGDAATVGGYSPSDLTRPKNTASFTSSNTSLNINQSSWTKIPWDVQLDVDGGYTHDPAGSPTDITFDNAGTYRVKVMITYDSSRHRINPGVRFAINGSRRNALGLSGYSRHASGHYEASNYVEELVTVNSGDTLTVQTTQYGNSGTVTLRSNESVLIVEQVSETVARAGDADTVDGYNAADFLLSGGDTMTGDLNMGSNDIFFGSGVGIGVDGNGSSVETHDGSGSRINLETKDTYIQDAGTWVGDHIADSDAHHVRYTDSEAVDAVGPRFQTGPGVNINYDSSNQIIGVTVDGAGDPVTAINNDSDHGSTAQHNYYTDSDAISALNGGDLQGLTVGDLNVSVDLDMQNNPIKDVRRIDGLNGNHRIRFDSNNSWIEFTDQSNSRNKIVTQDVYVNADNTWLGDHIGDSDAHHSRYTDGEARSAVRSGMAYLDFHNKEQGDYNHDGRLYWDKSAGLYIKSSNADGNPRLLWSGANVKAGNNINISYDNEDEPTISATDTQKSCRDIKDCMAAFSRVSFKHIYVTDSIVEFKPQTTHPGVPVNGGRLYCFEDSNGNYDLRWLDANGFSVDITKDLRSSSEQL